MTEALGMTAAETQDVASPNHDVIESMRSPPPSSSLTEEKSLDSQMGSKPPINIPQRRWRYEFKYIVARHLRSPLLADLRTCLQPDRFGGVDGSYEVRSLYLDSPTWKSFHDKLDGVSIRQKLRIRTYPSQGAEPRYKFEVKHRHGNRNSKDVTQVSHTTYLTILPALSGGRFVSPAILRRYSSLRSFLYTKQLYAMSPAVLVSFRRIALTSSQDRQLRVTLDNGITGSRSRDILRPDRHSIALIPSQATVLEVKLDRQIPLWLQRTLSKYRLRWQSISKYELGVSQLPLGLEMIM